MLKDEWQGSIPGEYTETHRHRFTNGESRQEREAWLNEQLGNAGLSRTEMFCQETEDGYDFAFKDFKHYAAFYLNAFGDPKTDCGQQMHHAFEEDVDPYWIKAAEMYLQHLGIDYAMHLEGKTVSFGFDRFSESAALRLMADNGDIERMARALERSDGFLGFMRQFLGGPSADDEPQLHLSL
jgi:hypothetical protein